MPLVIFPLVFSAIAAFCSGQSTTPFSPRSICGIYAQTCYNDQEEVMNNKLNSLDFASACLVYKSTLSCMLNVGNCTTDSDFQVVRQRLDSVQDGICGVDGSIQSCGRDVHVCFTEMDTAIADALVKNFSNACVLSSKFIACASNLTNVKECPDSLVSKVKDMQQTLNSIEQSMGCDGPCPQAVAFCTNNATTLPTNESILSMNLDSFCRSANKVYACLNGLQTNIACTSSSQSYLKDIALNELTKVGDICTPDGNISVCVKSLVQCAAYLTGIHPDSGISAQLQCTASSEFLECISRLPCTSTLIPMIANFRASIETTETALQCPSVGSCSERFTKCGTQDQGFANISSLNREAVCKTAAVMFTCLNFVKNDPICINEKNSFADQGQSIYTLINKECGVNTPYGVTSGPNTSGSTTTASATSTFTPRSVCGIGALRCYSAQHQVMDDKFEALDYASACQYYKSIVVCMEHVGDCATDSDFDVVRQQLLSDMDGICGIDGSIQNCGKDINDCFTTMYAGVTDVLLKNFSAACSLIGEFATCAASVITVEECPDSLVRKLTQMQQSLSSDASAMKCDGPCPMAIQTCIANVTTMPVDHSILEVDLTEFCRSASKVYNCLNNLETSAACSTSSLSYLKTFVQNQLTKMRDVCNTDGTTTSCVSDLDQCAVDLLVISDHSNTATNCKAMSEFIECFSQLPCSTTLAPLIAIVSSRFETDETEMQCPSVGSCNDRWAKCGHQEQGLDNVTSTDKETICKTAKTGIKCFNFVKSDPLCINEKNGFITQEQSLNMLLKTKCGASSWLIQLPLFVAALLAGGIIQGVI